ncbi:6643_t:CDS:1 [Diversispora eburnea]|uniref:6643_t:CDS:1 n=1 Tax=Diversispora eburnea TaxID=1213867 RepID=A0A9N8VJZ3_9GLOM|nr:6643_t:CDS:1 [Diversispora eburnea]
MPTLIRPVNNLERFYLILQNVSNYTNVGFTIRYRWDELYQLNTTTNSVNTELAKKSILQILYPTLTTLLQNLPNLSVCIHNANSNKPIYLQLDEIDLSSLVKFVSISSDQDLEKLIEHEHDLKFNLEDESKPLWRIVVGIYKYGINKTPGSSGEDSGIDGMEKIRRSDYDFCIFFCWHHVIGDGMSAFAIHGTFLKVLKQTFKEYNETPKRKTHQPYLPSSKILTKNLTTRMHDPIETLHDLQPSILSLIKEGCSEFLLPSFLQKQLKGQYWTGDKHLKNTPYYQNRIKIFSLPSRYYEKIISVIKSNQTTFHSLFNTAILFSSYHHLLSFSFNGVRGKRIRNRKRRSPAASDNTLKIMTPVSVRKYTSPNIPWTEMGNFVGETVFNYSFPKPSFSEASSANTSTSNSARNSTSTTSTTNSRYSTSSRLSSQSTLSRRSASSRKSRKIKYNKNNKIRNINFWELCHTFKYQLEKSIPEAIGDIGLLGFLPKDRKYLETYYKNKKNLYPNGRAFSIMPSNLGKFPKLDENGIIDIPIFEVTSPIINNERNSILLEKFEENRNQFCRRSSFYGHRKSGREEYYSDSIYSDNGSNGGGEEFNNSNGWEIVDMIFSQSIWKDGPATIVNAITYENKFNITISYQEGSVAEDKIERFGEGIIKCLKILADKGDVEIHDIILY